MVLKGLKKKLQNSSNNRLAFLILYQARITCLKNAFCDIEVFKVLSIIIMFQYTLI